MTIGYRGDRDLGFDFVLFCSAFVVSRQIVALI